VMDFRGRPLFLGTIMEGSEDMEVSRSISSWDWSCWIESREDLSSTSGVGSRAFCFFCLTGSGLAGINLIQREMDTFWFCLFWCFLRNYCVQFVFYVLAAVYWGMVTFVVAVHGCQRT